MPKEVLEAFKEVARQGGTIYLTEEGHKILEQSMVENK